MSAIKPGDLVTVVRTPHPCLSSWLGRTFVVTGLGSHGTTICGVCFMLLPDDTAVYGDGSGSVVALSRLQKIEPPAVRESARIAITRALGTIPSDFVMPERDVLE